MKFQFIAAAKESFPVSPLCQVLGVSQSGYFAWRSRPASPRQREDLVLLAHIRSAFARSKGTYGSPRLTRELQDEGLEVGRRRTARLMRENGLKARQRRRFTRTTDSHHAFPVAPISSSRTSRPSARTRNGPQIFRTYGQAEDVYRQLFNSELFLLAYGKISRNAGAMTPGITAETVDGMSLAKIGRIIDALRRETYRWLPVRRIYIEKKGSMKKRPLGLPTWSDKLLQEAIRLILEAYYEPQFSPASHGFRPSRGCHTALDEIYHCWAGTKWFVEGDIAQCFDTLDHSVLLSILSEKIHDGRFLRLIGNLLQAGYLEDWRYNATLSGCPQGSVLSPILSNIYLDRLDRFVETTLLPK